MGDLPKKKMMVSLWRVTYPSGKNDGLIVMGDLPQWKMIKMWIGLILMGDLPKEKNNGLIMMGDLPRWNDGLIMMGDLPRKMMVSLLWVTYPNERWWSHYDGWHTQMQDDGLIMMGDLPRWKMMSHYDGWPTQKKWWSHYDEWPTQMKVVVSLWWVTYS
jgi:hypothetical protein